MVKNKERLVVLDASSIRGGDIVLAAIRLSISAFRRDLGNRKSDLGDFGHWLGYPADKVGLKSKTKKVKTGSSFLAVDHVILNRVVPGAL
jgi:hypothetical protein